MNTLRLVLLLITLNVVISEKTANKTESLLPESKNAFRFEDQSDEPQSYGLIRFEGQGYRFQLDDSQNAIDNEGQRIKFEENRIETQRPNHQKMKKKRRRRPRQRLPNGSQNGGSGYPVPYPAYPGSPGYPGSPVFGPGPIYPGQKPYPTSYPVPHYIRDRVRKFFNPEAFDPTAFRNAMASGMMGMMVGELVVYILLKQSAELGDLPSYVPDTLIIGISAFESLLGPLLGWWGSEKRRSMMKGWVFLSLVCSVPLFALPGPDTIPDDGLCTGVTPTVRKVLVGITSKAAVRLSLLLICAVAYAFGRVAMMSHGLAHLNEYNPSDNLLMHVGIIFLHRFAQLLFGNIFIKSWTLNTLWLQLLLMFIQFFVSLLGLHRYPVVPPTVEKLSGNNRSLIRSLARVLSSKVAMLQMLAMSLLAAALWGFSSQEAEFVKVKYRIVATIGKYMAPLVYFVQVVLAILLVGYMYTTPVMAKFDRRAAVRNSMTMCLISTLLYIALTLWLGCNQGEIAGLAEQTYIQPVCAQSCGCDRPWIQFTPVCAPEQLTTYYSPCHAGCAASATFNGLDVYSNCTCAPLGRVTIGACDDGSCAHEQLFHQLLYVLLVTLSGLAIVWQGTMIIESVDRRDVSVALGLASGMVALSAFVGAHVFYLGISKLTCVFREEPKCLFHNEQFVPWVGYSSATLAGLALLVSIVTLIIVWREKKKTEEALTDATEVFC